MKAKLAGTAVFVAILLVGTPLAYNAISHLLLTQTTFAGGALPERFRVAFRELSPAGEPGPVRLGRWMDIEAARRQGTRFTFILPSPGGLIDSAHDLHAYSVVENRGASQVIETRYRNTHAEWARYEVSPQRIVPISWRQDGGGFMIVPMAGILVLAALAAAMTTRAVRRRLAPPGAVQ
jgi:hypothetical protein